MSLKDATIPHEVFSHYCGAKVLLRPASPGTGIIAGKTVRCGARIRRRQGHSDQIARFEERGERGEGTLNALLSLRLREDIYKSRGLEIKKVQPESA